MAHARKSGTAWERTREDYAYGRDLNLTGWAWEFLRRNEAYRRDCRSNRAEQSVAIRHMGDTAFYQPSRRFVEAEAWGLTMFADPNRTATEVDIFWLPELLAHVVFCHCEPANDDAVERLSLSSFQGRKAILVGIGKEQLVISGPQQCAHLVICKGSMLFGGCTVTFLHEGLATASKHHKTMQILMHFTSESAATPCRKHRAENKFLDYLIALDGHLEGRSYREIAEVLYGKDRVGTYWSNDTRWMKSKVRRAVERGMSLMNGGYRDLL
jgi:hypothetical protein